jgi:undecaprenyl-diphosphatase
MPDADRAVLRRLTARPGTRKAALIRVVAGLADDLKPWLVATPLLLALRRRPGSVGRAWAAVGLAAAVSGVASAAIGRHRPSIEVQDRTRAADPPTSGSMPSNHTASAAAFVAAVVSTDPVAGAFLVPVAGFVAWSRVASSRHYPTDVAAGLAVGVASAGAVALVARRVPGGVRSVAASATLCSARAVETPRTWRWRPA